MPLSQLPCLLLSSLYLCLSLSIFLIYIYNFFRVFLFSTNSTSFPFFLSHLPSLFLYVNFLVFCNIFLISFLHLFKSSFLYVRHVCHFKIPREFHCVLSCPSPPRDPAKSAFLAFRNICLQLSFYFSFRRPLSSLPPLILLFQFQFRLACFTSLHRLLLPVSITLFVAFSHCCLLSFI